MVCMMSYIICHVENNDGFDSDDDVALSHVANKLQGMWKLMS